MSRHKKKRHREKTVFEVPFAVWRQFQAFKAIQEEICDTCEELNEAWEQFVDDLEETPPPTVTVTETILKLYDLIREIDKEEVQIYPKGKQNLQPLVATIVITDVSNGKI